MSQTILVATSPGELIDKITILEIKSERIKDEQKLANVRIELEILQKCLQQNVESSETLSNLHRQLREVNESLWVIEDDIRDCEREKDFGPIFIELARAVYVTNDKRAVLKKEINLLLGSGIVEEKSYQAY
jgi:hypothetical protein